jgi:aminopeptidase N
MSFWYLKSRADKAKALFAEFTPMLDFYEQMIGPYPFRDEKMGVVETPHLGMEHQTINAYGNEYKKDVYGFDWLLQHEFAHEWFGNQLTNLDNDDMWLHEGFGTYMQPLYLTVAAWRHGVHGAPEPDAGRQQEQVADRLGQAARKTTSTTPIAAPGTTSTTRPPTCCTRCGP